jgi:hypothetical protein
VHVQGCRLTAVSAVLAVAVSSGCTGDRPVPPTSQHPAPSRVSPRRTIAVPRSVPRQFRRPLPGMAPVTRDEVYAAAAAPGGMHRSVAADRPLLYVPSSSGPPTTTVVDQRTHEIVRVLRTGELSQHVTPSWDLRSLYVEASASNQLLSIVGHTDMPSMPHGIYPSPRKPRRAAVEDRRTPARAGAVRRRSHRRHDDLGLRR